MKKLSTIGVLATLLVLAESYHFGDDLALSRVQLDSVREVCGLRSDDPLDCNVIQARLMKSRWRNSVPDVIQALIASSDPKEMELGWRLSEMQGKPQKWTKADIDRLLAESNEHVKKIGVRSVSVTDAAWSGECIERILLDPAVSQDCQSKIICDCLAKVPNVEMRAKIWAIAANKGSLREECLTLFPLVASSERAVKSVTAFLDDESLIRIAVSNHFAMPIEARVLAARVLGDLGEHKEIAIQELYKRCAEDPAASDLTFAVESMVAARLLSPDAKIPKARLTRWFQDIPSSRETILERLEGVFPCEREFEAVVIGNTSILSSEEIASFCRWLSYQKASPQAIRYLKGLLKHEHPGVRAAAVVAMGVQDPLYNSGTIKDDLLKAVCKSPEDFAMPFEDLESAFTALAFAGASDDEALQWLRSQKSPELIVLAKSAIDNFTTNSKLFADTPTARDTPWAQRPFIRRSRSGE